MRPFIGARRRPIPRWQIDGADLARLDITTPPSDTHGALDRGLINARLLDMSSQAHLIPPWHGLRVVAADGSALQTVTLQRQVALRQLTRDFPPACIVAAPSVRKVHPASRSPLSTR